MHELYDKLCSELEEYGRKDLSMETLKTVDTLAHAAKNVLKILECEEGGSYAYYDEDPGTTAMGSMRGSYGRSYRMSGKRDSMGRYSREGGSYGNTSMRMSKANGNNVTDGLKELMYAAPQEMQGEINRLIKKLENM